MAMARVALAVSLTALLGATAAEPDRAWRAAPAVDGQRVAATTGGSSAEGDGERERGEGVAVASTAAGAAGVPSASAAAEAAAAAAAAPAAAAAAAAPLSASGGAPALQQPPEQRPSPGAAPGATGSRLEVGEAAQQPAEVSGGELALGVNASVIDLSQGRAFRCGIAICPQAAVCCLSRTGLSASCCGLEGPILAYPYTSSVCRFETFNWQTHRREQNTEGRGRAFCLGCNPNVPGGCANPRGGSAFSGSR